MEPKYKPLDGFANPNSQPEIGNPREYFTFSGGVGPINMATYYTQSNGIGVAKAQEAYWGVDLGFSPQSAAAFKESPPQRLTFDSSRRRRMQADSDFAGAYTEAGFGWKSKQKEGEGSSQYEDRSQVTKITLKDGNTGDRFWSVFLPLCLSASLPLCLSA